MSEQSREPEPVKEEVSGLEQQAQSLRREALVPPRVDQAYSPLQKLLIWGLLILSVGGSTLLLLSAEGRLTLIGRLADEWARLYQSDEARGIHKLPPPPPRRARARVRVETPILIAPSEPMLPTLEPDRKQGAEALVPPSKNRQTEAAYGILREKSEAAGRLVRGEVTGLTFKEWQPVSAEHPVYLIDLVAVRQSDQKEVHHIWSVNIADSSLEAMSQAARDLR